MKKNRNSGFTLVELLIVIAIISIMGGIVSLSISTVYGAESKKCANQLDALISQTKVATLAGAADTYLEVYLAADGYRADLHENGEVSLSTKIARPQAELYFKEKDAAGNETETQITDTDHLLIEFNRSTGSLRTVTDGGVGHNCILIRVDFSVTNYIQIVPKTGFHKVIR